MKEMIQLARWYGNLRPWQDYSVVGEGFDYLKVKHRGGIVNVPTNLIATEQDILKHQQALKYLEVEEEENDEEGWE